MEPIHQPVSDWLLFMHDEIETTNAVEMSTGLNMMLATRSMNAYCLKSALDLFLIGSVHVRILHYECRVHGLNHVSLILKHHA